MLWTLITKSLALAQYILVLALALDGAVHALHEVLFRRESHLSTSSISNSALPTSPAVIMAAANQAAGSSTDTFTAIFNVASTEYQTLTGEPLDTHPLATQLDSCHTPEAISNVLQKQAQEFIKFRKRDDKLMAWLDPMVNILFTFSATLGEGISLVSPVVYSIRFLS